MGVIKGRTRAAVTATSDDDGRTTPDVVNQLAFLDTGVTTDDGASEIEPEAHGNVNDAIHSGRIHLLATRRSQLGRRNARSRHPAVPENTTPPPKISTHGSKKFRRYENQLELLKECDENEPEEVSIEDFINGANTARTFSKILQHSAMLELWNKHKEPEPELLSAGKDAKRNSARGNGINCDVTTFDADEAFQGICRRLRSLLKQRHFPLGMMENFEEDLIEFFCTRPQDTFESDPMDGFQRALLHALSQYNNLRSHSIKCKENVKENAKKVRVHPSNQPFSPPPVRLVVYLENKYHAPKKSS